jgi:hypothetical protein
MLKKLVSILLCITMIGCTTFIRVERPIQNNIGHQLNRGDTVLATMKSGEVIKLKVVAISDFEISGLTSKGNSVTLKYTEIKELSKKRFSTAKTTGLAVVGSIFLIIVATVVLNSLFDDDALRKAGDESQN